MAILSFLGDPAFGDTSVLRLGWDLLAVTVFSLVIFRWAVRQGIASNAFATYDPALAASSPHPAGAGAPRSTP
jgi:hypothetical protein